MFVPTPVKDSSKVLLQKNVKPKEIERKSNRRNLENVDMFAPSPPASVNSGSSGYRRTKERRSVTTINAPGSKLISHPENWYVFMICYYFISCMIIAAYSM